MSGPTESIPVAATPSVAPAGSGIATTIDPATASSVITTANAIGSATSAPMVLSINDIEIATRAADHFQRIFYTTYDSKSRLVDLPKLYRPTSSITWNGTAYEGADGMKDLMSKMPSTKHEVQSFDCHPIPGPSPPHLLVTASGTVTHGRFVQIQPKSRSRNIEGQPRVFHQTFVLVPDTINAPTTSGETGKYYISTDVLRFVG